MRRRLAAQARRPSCTVTPFTKRRRIGIPPFRVSGFCFLCATTRTRFFWSAVYERTNFAFYTAVSALCKLYPKVKCPRGPVMQLGQLLIGPVAIFCNELECCSERLTAVVRQCPTPIPSPDRTFCHALSPSVWTRPVLPANAEGGNVRCRVRNEGGVSPYFE